MIPTHTLRALFLTWGKCILLFLTLSTVNAQEQLSLHFLKPETGASFFKDDPENLRVVTTADTLQVVGQSPGTSAGMVVFGVNGKESPKYLRDGEFTAKIGLQKGSNQISATLPTGFAKTVSYEVILIEPAEISQVRLRSEGGEDELGTPERDEAGLIQSQVVNVPQIRIAGKQTDLAGFAVKAKDPAGNPILIESYGEQFFADYTLTEGSNVLTFQSTFENQVFHEEKMDFVLEDVISISLDDEKNPEGFFETGDGHNSYSCLNSEVFLKGYVQAVTNGSVVLTVDDDPQQIEVVDHAFETSVSLTPNALTTVKVSLETNGQVYFDFIEIQQSQPTVELIALNEGLLNGAVIEEGEAVRSDENGQYFTESPIVNIAAKTNSVGTLTPAIVNLTTEEVFPVEIKDGQFTKTVYLREGENSLVLRVGNEAQTVDAEICDVKVVSPVVFETVNDSPVESDIVNLSGNRCVLYGIVDAVSRGFLSLKIDGSERTVPIVGGYFETPEALVLTPGEHIIEASVRINQRIYKNSITVIAEDVPVDNTVVGANDIDEEDIMMQHDRQAASFSPPIPRRMPSPGRVYDRVSNTQAVGSVTVQFVIGKNGRVDYDTVTVVESTNTLLNREAMRSVARWRFTAATDANGPIDKTARVTLTWK